MCGPDLRPSFETMVSKVGLYSVGMSAFLEEKEYCKNSQQGGTCVTKL